MKIRSLCLLLKLDLRWKNWPLTLLKWLIDTKWWFKRTYFNLPMPFNLCKEDFCWATWNFEKACNICGRPRKRAIFWLNNYFLREISRNFTPNRVLLSSVFWLNIFTISSAFSRSLIRRRLVREINLSPEMIHKTNGQGDDKCCLSVDLH